jgi:hypothetical protein
MLELETIAKVILVTIGVVSYNFMIFALFQVALDCYFKNKVIKIKIEQEIGKRKGKEMKLKEMETIQIYKSDADYIQEMSKNRLTTFAQEISTLIENQKKIKELAEEFRNFIKDLPK